MSRVLAIDWGATMGFASFADGTLQGWVSVPFGVHSIEQGILKADIVLFEQWFLSKQRQGSPQVAAYHAMTPKVLCELYGKPYRIVAPRTWQAWAKTGGNKAKIRTLASEIAEYPVKEHAADAICIGAWYCSEVLKCSQ